MKQPVFFEGDGGLTQFTQINSQTAQQYPLVNGCKTT